LPDVPGEQPRIANLVKLNTNESPFGLSPLALEAARAAATENLRLCPDPDAAELREALAAHHGVTPEQVFVGNGSDEVLAHAFVAHLKQPKPLLFPDITYSFYPVWAQDLRPLSPLVDRDTGRTLLRPKRRRSITRSQGAKDRTGLPKRFPITIAQHGHSAVGRRIAGNGGQEIRQASRPQHTEARSHCRL
jgi:hypothetical protein